MPYVIKNTSGGSFGLQLENSGLSMSSGGIYDVTSVCSIDWILYDTTFRSLIANRYLTVIEDTITGQSEQFPSIIEDSSGDVSIANNLDVAGDLTVDGNIIGQLDITAVDDLTVADRLTTKDLSMSGDVLTDLSVLGNITQTKQGITGHVSIETTAGITLYVETTGDDSNSGQSISQALKTPQEAYNRIPKDVGHVVRIVCGEGTFSAVGATGFRIFGAGSFTFEGTLGAPTIASGTTYGTATGGSTTSLIDGTQAWTNNNRG